MTKKRVLLNRPVFAQQSFDSSALTVLTTLFHRFEKAGDYDLIIQRDRQVIYRANVRVQVDDAPMQHNINMAADPVGDESGYTLSTNGVLGFFASQGTGSYTVRISQITGREKQTLLDSAEVIPEDDFFAVTLVRPGSYQVMDAQGKAACQIEVSLPKGEKHRTDQATMIEIGKGGVFKPNRVSLLAGQTVVFQCRSPQRIRVELSDTGAGRPIERGSITIKKPPTRLTGK